MSFSAHRKSLLFSWSIYPVLMISSLLLHGLLLTNGASLEIATMIPVLLGTVMVTVLERIMPHENSWQGTWQDVRQDAVYMILIQVLFPRLLGLLLVIVVVGNISGHIPASSLWPHAWPLPAQAVLMLVSADFLRYWLHRLAHENALLWRFHAVHHSPRKLYWLNVGRFHPLDKALQYLLDALPFILLGVNEHVIALYFVFYAVNGFLQHSNVQMKFGPLNYLISTAELHRWHHSRITEESNNNYGNNLIIWDILFGTRYLPDGRDIHQLGLQNDTYPMDFGAQLVAPFTSVAEVSDDSRWQLIQLRNWVTGLWFRLYMLIIETLYWRPLLKATRNPARLQHKLLQSILTKNQDTRYGKDHDFESIINSEAIYTRYCQLVAVNEYEAIRAYVDEQMDSQVPALITEKPVLFAVTSGTTAEAKFLPVGEHMLKRYKRDQKLFTYLQYRRKPAAFAGSYLGIVGAGIEGYTKRGIPYGSISGVLNMKMPKLVQSRYVIPAAVFAIDDYELKYYLILRLALGHSDLSYIVCANPSTLLKLESLMNNNMKNYVRDIEMGTVEGITELPQGLRDTLTQILKPDPVRSRELRIIEQQQSKIHLKDVWPSLQMITTWTGGSCGIAVGALQQSIDSSTAITELGYVSSEFRGTLPYDEQNGAGIPTLQDNFFEFIAVDEYESGHAQYQLLHQLDQGKEYYVVVTTGSGLYRYFMNDIVRVEGYLNKTPLLVFVQKGRGVTSITGEKIYESQVIEAVKTACDLNPVFYVMVADPVQSRYTLYIEVPTMHGQSIDKVAERIDQQLSILNMEYRAKRGSGRLLPLQMLRLKQGTGDVYRKACVKQGQKEGQYKHIILQYKQDLSFDFNVFLV